ncbi:uncharacterized protein wu:fc17b08 [Callorhinchus milii]|uniref:uncharacterized protein wu:fc17b08 n=1 Tax=Callorhinchus milii TaxID=7868 RepID=UPI001C3F5A19|nr:uncharacterized protein wu:fc17b08 [Callorhinchus milii]
MMEPGQVELPHCSTSKFGGNSAPGRTPIATDPRPLQNLSTYVQPSHEHEPMRNPEAEDSQEDKANMVIMDGVSYRAPSPGTVQATSSGAVGASQGPEDDGQHGETGDVPAPWLLSGDGAEEGEIDREPRIRPSPVAELPFRLPTPTGELPSGGGAPGTGEDLPEPEVPPKESDAQRESESEPSLEGGGAEEDCTDEEKDKEGETPAQKPPKTATPEKRQRKRLSLPASDRRLRSQQPPGERPQPSSSPPLEGCKQEPPLLEGLQMPYIKVKLLRGQREGNYTREVDVSRAVSVHFPGDCLNKSLLESITDPQSQLDEAPGGDVGKEGVQTRKTVKNAGRGLSGKEFVKLVEEGLSGGGSQGRNIEIHLDTQDSHHRKVSFSSESGEAGRLQDSLDGEEDDDSAVRLSCENDAHLRSSPRKPNLKESSKSPRGASGEREKTPDLGLGASHPGKKGTNSQPLLGESKGEAGLREASDAELETPLAVLGERESCAAVTDTSHQGETDNQLDSSDMDLPGGSRPKFLDWCSEDENQELITTLSTKYERLHKVWVVQAEKEGPALAKGKCKSDRLKEIWKSKRRSRKARGDYDHKSSPVQKLFLNDFNLVNICRWFMETTETRSLVIIKKVNSRLSPVDNLKTKSYLQKLPLGGLFPSAQAERLKKHLKKFAVVSPARNNWKTRALVERARLGLGEEQSDRENFLLDSTEGMVPRNLFPSQARGGGGQAGDVSHLRVNKKVSPPKPLGLKKPVSSWILRKYSNMRDKLRAQHRFKPSPAEPRHKSVCMNPLVSPKLTSQTQLDSCREPPPPRPEESRGRGKAVRRRGRQLGRSRPETEPAAQTAKPGTKVASGKSRVKGRLVGSRSSVAVAAGNQGGKRATARRSPSPAVKASPRTRE